MTRRALALSQLFALLVSFSVPTLAAAPQNMSFVVVKRATSSLAIILESGKTLRLVGLDGFPVSGDAAKDRAGRAEAAEYLNKLVAGKRIWLEYEPARVDKLGNLLGYAFLLDNGTHVNAAMIEKGYATAFTHAYYKHRDEFEKLQASAEKEKSGLWASYVPPAPKKPVRPAEPVAKSVETAQSGESDLSFDSGDTKGSAGPSTPSTSTASSGSARGTSTSSRGGRSTPDDDPSKRPTPREREKPTCFISTMAGDTTYHTGYCDTVKRERLIYPGKFKLVPLEEAAGYTKCTLCR